MIFSLFFSMFAMSFNDRDDNEKGQRFLLELIRESIRKIELLYLFKKNKKRYTKIKYFLLLVSLVKTLKTCLHYIQFIRIQCLLDVQK